MGSLVSDEVRLVSELCMAEGAGIRPFSRMGPRVCGESGPLSKPCRTDRAAVGSLPRVSLPVVFHMSGLVGRVLTPLALEPAVPADVTVTYLHVSVQMLLSQTSDVAVGTLKCATNTCETH